MAKGISAFALGEFRAAKSLSDSAAFGFRNECVGTIWEMTTAQSFAIWSMYYLGEIREISNRLPVLCQEAEERGNLYALTNHKSFSRCLVLLAADQPETAERELYELIAGWNAHWVSYPAQ